MITEDDVKTVMRRLANLETHLINLIVPIQGITQTLTTPGHSKDLVNLLSKPMLIDDRSLRGHLQEFRLAITEFKKEMEAFKEDVGKLNLSQTLSEIKFIGKRLDGIEKALSEMNEKGINKNIQLEFSVDGYQLVRKPVSYDRNDPIEEPKDDLKKLLDTLTEREAKVLMHRFGLLGEKKKTHKAVGLIFKVSRERIRQIESRGLRKLRLSARRNLVDKITHKELKKSITGEDD